MFLNTINNVYEFFNVAGLHWIFSFIGHYMCPDDCFWMLPSLVDITIIPNQCFKLCQRNILCILTNSTRRLSDLDILRNTSAYIDPPFTLYDLHNFSVVMVPYMVP